MQRNLRRRKNAKKPKYPKKPKTVTDVKKTFEDKETAQKFGRNLRNTEQFYIDTVVKKQSTKDSFFTIFASFQILNMVAAHIPACERIWMMDGTFDVTPVDVGYYQLLIIYIQYKNDVS